MKPALSLIALVILAGTASGQDCPGGDCARTFSYGWQPAQVAYRPAPYTTTNFAVNAPTPELAKEIGETAEYWRKQMAVYWTGKEMPHWAAQCPVNARVRADAACGGTTTFNFVPDGSVRGFRMSIEGPRGRLLDSVLPHEITHTVLASHFGKPLPRWVDEGACSTVENRIEIARHERSVIAYLKNKRGIPFDQMLAMRQYPRDVMPVYSQGHSVCSWLIESAGRERFMEFIGNGLQDDNWQRAIKDVYGFENSRDMQERWLAWVKAGRPQFSTVAHTANRASGASPHCIVKNTAGQASDVASGTLIGKTSERGIVVTCWHELRDLNGTLSVHFSDGGIYPAKLLDFSQSADVAVFAIAPPEAEPIPIAPGFAPSGQLLAVGYPGGSTTLRAVEGALHPSSQRMVSPAGWQAMYGYGQMGESGGAVLNARGEFVGVRHSTDGERIMFTCGETLEGIVGKFLPNRLQVMPAQWRGTRGSTGGTYWPPVVQQQPLVPVQPIPNGQYPNGQNGTNGGDNGFDDDECNCEDEIADLQQQITKLQADLKLQIDAHLNLVSGLDQRIETFLTSPAAQQHLTNIINNAIDDAIADGGLQGPPGPPGEPGQLADSDIENITNEVVQNLPPFWLRIVDADKQPRTEYAEIYLGNRADLEIDAQLSTPAQ